MKIFLEIIALVLSLGALIYWSISGFRKNILGIFVMLIFGAYVVWPLILIHELSLDHFLNIQVDAYVEQGLFLDIIFMTMFIVAYEFLGKKVSLSNSQKRYIETSTVHHVILGLYVFLFCLIYLNNSLAGIDLMGKWLGYSNQMTYGVKGITYYLQNLIDSLVMLILIGYASNIKRKYLILMLFGAIFFIIPFGFRYRLIYLILGFFILYVYKNQFSFKKFVLPAILLFCLIFAFLFLGANRTIIAGQDHAKQLTFQLLDTEKIVIQARGSYVDLAIYQGIDKGDISHDLGKSFFYYIPVRFIPASFFENSTKPYPPRLMQDVDKVLNIKNPPNCPNCRTGEAQTIMGSVYYSFGALGIIVIASILGFIVGFQSRNNENFLSYLWGISTLLVLFMFITRGYFPQIVDNWVFLVAPLGIIQVWVRGFQKPEVKD